MTIKEAYNKELKKAKERAKKLPEGWEIASWPKMPKTKKELDRKVKELQKVSIKTLNDGTLPSFVKYSTEVMIGHTKTKTYPITHKKLKELQFLKNMAEYKKSVYTGFDPDKKLDIAFTSKAGYKKMASGLKKRNKTTYYKIKNRTFKENFIQSMEKIIAQTNAILGDKKNHPTGAYKEILERTLKAAEGAMLKIMSLSDKAAAHLVISVCGKDTKIINRLYDSDQIMLSMADVKKLEKIAEG